MVARRIEKANANDIRHSHIRQFVIRYERLWPRPSGWRGAGDVVLLSPGGTSYDAFKDFAERGDGFRGYVNG